MERVAKKGALALAVMTGVTLLMGGAADAAILQETIPFNVNSEEDLDGFVWLTFNQFDDALGPLTDVEFVLDSTATSTVSVLNQSEDDSSEAENVGMFEVAFTSTASTPLFFVFGYVSCEDIFCTNQTDESFSGTYPLDIAGFAGLGTFNSVLYFSSGPRLLDCSRDNSCSVVSEESWVGWVGSLTVRYTYDAVGSSVPEPGTLALLGLGLLGLGFARRRKQ